MNQKPSHRKNSYYRLLDSNLPKIGSHRESKSDRYANMGKSLDLGLSPQKQTERILRSQQFLYIDLDDQIGCKPMEKATTPEDRHEEVQKVGKNYIGNLKYLSQRNQQTIDYCQRSKEFSEQKESIRKVVKREIDKSLQKLKSGERKKKDRKLYGGFSDYLEEYGDSDRLKLYLEQREYETLDKKMWDKEKKVVQKFGIISNYVSSNEDNQISLLKSRKVLSKKLQLPSIVYRTIAR